MDKISRGAIPPKITASYNGDFNAIKNNLNNCIDNINALVADAGMLVKAAVEGKLATRADAARHEGDYRRIVEGVNQTLDAVIGPLNVSADYVDKISRGAIPAKITDSYNGDFNAIKNNLNNCIDNINALVADAGMFGEGGGGGQTRDARRRRAPPGRLSQDRRGSEPDARRRNRAAERVGGLRGQDQPGRDSGQDHRELQRRFQRHQETT